MRIKTNNLKEEIRCMEHSDFSSDISSDDFIDDDEHHEHEQTSKYFIIIGLAFEFLKW